MPSRRAFLIGSVAIAGGVAIGFYQRLPDKLPGTIPLQPGQVALTPYVLVDNVGITIVAPRAEMGQGIHTTLAALVAEELDVNLEQVNVVHGPASEHYSNSKLYGPRPYPGRTHGEPTQATGGQTSIRDGFFKMRSAGAAARKVLIQAAAQRLGVPEHSLRTANGAVIAPDSSRLPYEALAEAAANLPLDQNPPLKPRDQWRILGHSLPRVDMATKCCGTAEYGIDISLEGMLYATVKRCPYLGGSLLHADTAAAQDMPGVRKIVTFQGGVIIIASNTWYAFQAANGLKCRWSPPHYPADTAQHRAAIEAAFEGPASYQPIDRGDVEASLEKEQGLRATYRAPYLAHATMEPLNATALLADNRLDIWAGTQFPTLAQLVGARLAGLNSDHVHVHTPYLGGGFGRRFEMDDVEAAVLAALAMPGHPIKLTYTREEDFRHDTYRPMATARFKASIANEKELALLVDVAAPSLFRSGEIRRSRMTAEPAGREPKADVSISMGLKDQPYQFQHLRVNAYKAEELLPVGWWRSVGESQNTFFLESMIDEIAHASGKDPLALRLDHLHDEASRAALQQVATLSDWGAPLPPGHARGLAFALSSGAATAQVVEIRRTNDSIALERIFIAVDVGIALDPRNIEAQVEGAIGFGLSAAIYGEINIVDGRVKEGNFNDYRLLKMHQLPAIKVAILESGNRIFGVGEAGTPTTAPALGNALFAATGTRLRELPFSKHLHFL